MSPGSKISGLKLVAAVAYLLACPALMLWVSGDWSWTQGWIFAVWFVALFTVCMIWLYRKDPALLAERYRRPGSGGQSRADRWIVHGLTVGFFLWLLIPPLDVKRFGWTASLPAWLQIVGGILLLGASFFLFRAFTDNTYLSPLVRIQAERKHRVVSTGVYGFVRHPMYLGAVLLFVGAPLLLGSTAGLALGGAMTLLLAARIVGEERVLAQELDGYTEYRRKVRYRLLPFLW